MIATNSGTSYVADNSSLANFQSWTGALFTAIESLGWLQTADTGQAANPLAAVPSSTYVYRVYKANDALASTMPIYMKVMVGFSATSPRIQFVVGNASDGAGNITGPGTANAGITFVVTAQQTNNGSATFPCYFSGHAGEFRMYMWRNSAGNGPSCIFGIERSKSSGGADTGDYVTVFGASAGGNLPTNPWTSSGGVSTTSSQQSFSAAYMFRPQCNINMHPPTNTTQSDNGVVGSLPCFPVVGNLGNAMLGLAGACAADATDGAVVTVASMYGSTHSYLGAQNGTIMNRSTTSVTVNSFPTYLLRYE